MQTTFRLNASDVDERIVASIRSLFTDRPIEIAVTDLEMDETEYLLRDPAHRQHLLDAVGHIERREGLVTMTIDELHAMTVK